MKINWVKSTIFKSKIEGRALEGMQDAAKQWFDYVEKNGHLKKKVNKERKDKKPSLKKAMMLEVPSQRDEVLSESNVEALKP